jgi:hypothetical protein
MKRALILVAVAAILVPPPPVQAQDASARYRQEMADVAENAELCAGMFSLAVDNGWFPQDAARVRRLRDLWVGWLQRNRGDAAVARAREVAQTDANRFGANYVNGMVRSCMARDPKVLEGEVEKRYVRSPVSPSSVPQGQLATAYQYAAMCAGFMGSVTEGGLSVKANADATNAFRYWNWHAKVLAQRAGRATTDKAIRTDGFGWLRGGGYVEGLFRVTATGAEFGSRCLQEGDMGYEKRGGRF